MKKFCPYCGNAFVGARCQCRSRKRRATPGDATRGEREPWRLRYAWPSYRRARQEAIGRTRGACSVCGRACAERRGGEWKTARLGGEVHHIVPLADGGTDDADNLMLVCKSCHAKLDTAARRRAGR